MNKKEYIQPQIFFVPLQTESLLQNISKTGIIDNTGGGMPGGGVTTDKDHLTGGKDDLGSKEHFNDLDSLDSWE